MDMSIRGTFKAQFIIMMTSGIRHTLADCEPFFTVELMVRASFVEMIPHVQLQRLVNLGGSWLWFLKSSQHRITLITFSYLNKMSIQNGQFNLKCNLILIRRKIFNLTTIYRGKQLRSISSESECKLFTCNISNQRNKHLLCFKMLSKKLSLLRMLD